VVPQGQTVSAYGYDFNFNDWQSTPEGKGVLDMTVTRGSETFNAAPTLYFNPRMGATMATPSIRSEFFQDLYISPQEYEPPLDHNAAQLLANAKSEIGPYTITFLGFDASQAHSAGSGDIGAKLRVSYQGQDTIVTPVIRLVANEKDPAKAVQILPATLPGGQSIVFENFDPVQRWAAIRVNGLNLPTDPAKAVVMVSLKPGILLVWLGVGIGVLGGLIAMLRRGLEGRWQPGGQRTRLPRGLGGLARFVGSK
jgi:cytochrome c-type biogenesis protein CcmF